MARSSRQFNRAFKHLLKKIDGDLCTVCRKELTHNSLTFGGELPDGRVACVGECCRDYLEYIWTSGLYVDYGRNPGLEKALTQGRKEKPAGPPLSGEELFAAVRKLRDAVAEEDKYLDSLLRKAGLAGGQPFVGPKGPWVADDKQWFEGHPTRAHRARPRFPGEPAGPVDEQSDGPVLVRQIEPGVRTKVFLRDAIDVPDDEGFIHALFDRLADTGGSATLVRDSGRGN
jgi:hypothetical protein